MDRQTHYGKHVQGVMMCDLDGQSSGGEVFRSAQFGGSDAE